MSNLRVIDWKSKCKKELEERLHQCEKVLNEEFLNDTQRFIEIQIAYQISSALERFDHWGLCEMCNKPIEQKRLIALPYAEFCMDCQASLERRIVL